MFNESGHAAEFLRALHDRVSHSFRAVTLIVVDDGSSDGTAKEVREVMDQGLPIHFIRLSRNFGKETALSAGLDASARLVDRSNLILTIDSDFQHPLRLIEPMVELWERGIDMVYGIQERAGRESLPRRAMTWLFYRLLTTNQDRFEIPRDAGDFRLMDRCVVDALNSLPERNRFMKGLYAWVGFRSEGIRFQAEPRVGGRSSFGFQRLSALALDGITAFTTWPLRIASLFGLIISIVALSYAAWIVFERIWIGQPIPGFTTLAAAIMLFSGIQLISIGLLGEYISRIFMEAKGRPLYLIAEEHAVPVRARTLPKDLETGEKGGPS